MFIFFWEMLLNKYIQCKLTSEQSRNDGADERSLEALANCAHELEQQPVWRHRVDYTR